MPTPPTYPQLTVETTTSNLQKLTVKAADEKLTPAEKDVFKKAVSAQLDKVLAALQVAERSSRLSCKFKVDSHQEAKAHMQVLQQTVTDLANNFDPAKVQVVIQRQHAVEQIVKGLAQDDAALRDTGMVGQYRGGWPAALRGLVEKIAPERLPDIANVAAERQQGIALSTAAVTQAKRVTEEYVARIAVYNKAVERLIAANDNEQQSLGKLQRETFEMSKTIVAAATELIKDYDDNADRTQKYVKTFKAAAKPTKAQAELLTNVEASVEALTKRGKAKLKTMQLEMDQQQKAFQALGNPDRAAKAGHDKVRSDLMKMQAKLGELDKRITDFTQKDMADYRTELAKAKKVK